MPNDLSWNFDRVFEFSKAFDEDAYLDDDCAVATESATKAEKHDNDPSSLGDFSRIYKALGISPPITVCFTYSPEIQNCTDRDRSRNPNHSTLHLTSSAIDPRHLPLYLNLRKTSTISSAVPCQRVCDGRTSFIQTTTTSRPWAQSRMMGNLPWILCQARVPRSLPRQRSSLYQLLFLYRAHSLPRNLSHPFLSTTT